MALYPVPVCLSFKDFFTEMQDEIPFLLILVPSGVRGNSKLGIDGFNY